jgi:hypothetical protein
MKQIAIAILAVGLIFNSLIPLRTILLQSPEIIENTVVTGSTAFGVLSATALPFKTVGGITRAGITLCDELRDIPKGMHDASGDDAAAVSAIIPCPADGGRSACRSAEAWFGASGITLVLSIPPVE